MPRTPGARSRPGTRAPLPARRYIHRLDEWWKELPVGSTDAIAAEHQRELTQGSELLLAAQAEAGQGSGGFRSKDEQKRVISALDQAQRCGRDAAEMRYDRLTVLASRLRTATSTSSARTSCPCSRPSR